MTFTLQGSVYLTVLTGHEKYTFLRILSILMQIIQPLLVILCVSRIPYAITVSVVIVLLNLLTIGIRYGYVTRKLKIQITKQPKDSRIVKSILGLSAASCSEALRIRFSGKQIRSFWDECSTPQSLQFILSVLRFT